MALLSTTKLSAINTMLAVIGESSVNSLSSGLDEAISAENTLDEISRLVQSEGWEFNTEHKYPLPIDVDGHVPLPASLLRIDGEGKRYIRRGGKLYDKIHHTDIFTDTVYTTITLGLDFEDLPEVARQYIMVRAARVYQSREVGSTELHLFNKEDEDRAWYSMQTLETESSDLTIFDSVDLRVMLDRSATSFIHYPAGAKFDV